jgi:hypothetical protein
MAEMEDGYLAGCLAQGVCPVCKEPLGARVGSGRPKDGAFCSLTCYAQWHQAALAQRHKARMKGRAGE